jgi:hypothetical protein
MLAMKLVKILLISTFVVLTGCSLVSSSVHYTKGTESLERGDYANAIVELRQAVELCPDLPRNHINLRCAYILVGEHYKGWYCLEQARLCVDEEARQNYNFAWACKKYMKAQEVDKEGTPLEEVLAKLGTPDSRVESTDGETTCVYGACVMTFRDDKLTSCTYTSSK